MITAEIIADSKNQFGQRITTYILVFPRIILAEFNTHRMFSRNSASSRAIPFKKMVESVTTNPFIPSRWMKDHSGMQGSEFMDERESEVAKSAWLVARNRMVEQATYLSARGVTKQFCNRLLESFLWHTVIVTASEWENFFSLRAHPAAEIHMQELAQKMLDAYNASTPKILEPGDWHIPFGDKMDEERLIQTYNHSLPFGPMENLDKETSGRNTVALKVATARCARVSYMNFEGKDDYVADCDLHDRLSSMGHWSPFEHCARAMTESEMQQFVHTQEISTNPSGVEFGWSGNFRGFIQYRKFFQNENKRDNRVKQDTAQVIS